MQAPPEQPTFPSLGGDMETEDAGGFNFDENLEGLEWAGPAFQ
jgi:hypothetical protein